MRIEKAVLAALIATAIAGAASAGRDLTTLPGYVDFDKESIVGDMDATVEINLSTPLLKFLAGAASVADEEISESLHLIDHVRIQVYELDSANAEGVQSNIRRLLERLEKDEWSRIVHVEEELQIVNIYTRLDGDKMVGLALIVASESELVFINIVGEIEPARMGSLIGMVAGGGQMAPGLLDRIDESITPSDGDSSN